MSDESDYRNSWIGGGRGTTGPLNYPPLDEQYKQRTYRRWVPSSTVPTPSDPPEDRENPTWVLVSDPDVVRKTVMGATSAMREGLVKTSVAAVRFDEEKTQWGLLDWDFVEEITRGLMYGAKKYTDPYNYQKGLSYSRVFRAAMSHLTKWWRGTEIDEESGVHHLALAACNLMFAFYYTKRAAKYGEKFDDRPTRE